MTDPLETYLTVLTLGVIMTVVVGQILLRSGHAFLAEVFADPDTAASVNRLLAVLFHLFVLGVLALLSTLRLPVTGEVQTVVTKLGIMLLILGVAHGLTMLVLGRIRGQSRLERQFEHATGFPRA